MFLLSAPGLKPGRIAPLDILDVAPTLLKLLGQPVPADMQGNPIPALL